jgi:NAD(P)-dependent dehydrogenase (short-subunit alcohol dehydrogenase family)
MASVLVQGASRGLGLALVRAWLSEGATVLATCRDPSRSTELTELAASHAALRVLRLDVEDEASIVQAALEARAHVDRLHTLINVAGLLHDGPLQPEKKLEQADPTALARLFAVNATGPLLVAKHFLPLLTHDERAVLANVSARVGSIADNHLGGWYGYRASKAAQNMLTRTLAIELARRAPRLAVVALHPGTVDTELKGVHGAETRRRGAPPQVDGPHAGGMGRTRRCGAPKGSDSGGGPRRDSLPTGGGVGTTPPTKLSAPCSRRVPSEKLFTPERAARQLMSVIEGLTAERTGRFYAWDGSEIPW